MPTALSIRDDLCPHSFWQMAARSVTRIRNPRLGSPHLKGGCHVRTRRTEAKDRKNSKPRSPNQRRAQRSRVVVTVAGRIVADTPKALTLREASYPPVQYIPHLDHCRRFALPAAA